MLLYWRLFLSSFDVLHCWFFFLPWYFYNYSFLFFFLWRIFLYLCLQHSIHHLRIERAEVELDEHFNALVFVRTKWLIVRRDDAQWSVWTSSDQKHRLETNMSPEWPVKRFFLFCFFLFIHSSLFNFAILLIDPG